MVSAKAEIKKTKDNGKQIQKFDNFTWFNKISRIDNDSENKAMVKKIKPKEISYEIIWAAERKAPKTAYFELLAQPAPIIPKILKDEIANKYKRPKLESNQPSKIENGTKSHKSKLKENVKTGAKINNKKFALRGIIGSLKINFKPSAKGCNKPKKPTTLGPFRRWTEAIIFRSARV